THVEACGDRTLTAPSHAADQDAKSAVKDSPAVNFVQNGFQDANIGRAIARPTLLPAQPSNTESRFMFHFNNILAGLISFSFPQTSVPNPFSQHVLPQASSSVQVQCAVEAVAAAHLYHLGAESGDRATWLHSKALNLLATELSRPQLDETSRMNLLASSLLLIYYEVSPPSRANAF
ncbi:hypothetical protein F1880_008162, partial [Penicillium rolfsii]